MNSDDFRRALDSEDFRRSVLAAGGEALRSFGSEE